MNNNILKLNKPIENSYWVIPGAFLAAEYPRTIDEEASHNKIKSILDIGITCFIDLTDDVHLKGYEYIIEKYKKEYPNVKRINFKIKDGYTPTVDFMNEILNKIDELLCNGEKIYLHCWGGIGRTGTVVDCWLHKNVNGKINNNVGKNYFTGKIEENLDLLKLWCTNFKSLRKKSPKKPTNYIQRIFVGKWIDEFIRDNRLNQINLKLNDVLNNKVNLDLNQMNENLYKNLINVIDVMNIKIEDKEYFCQNLLLNLIKKHNKVNIEMQNFSLTFQNKNNNFITLRCLNENKKINTFLFSNNGFRQIEGL